MRTWRLEPVWKCCSSNVSIVKIRMGKKSVIEIRAMLCYLNNKNCCLNNTTKHPLKNKDLYGLHSRMIMEFETPQLVIDNSWIET